MNKGKAVDSFEQWKRLQAWEQRCKHCYGSGVSVDRVPDRTDGKLTRVPCPDCTVPYVLSRFSQDQGFPRVSVEL
jgi:hypothetical protein